jgi:predicted nucleic acid-binding protein
MALRYAVDTNVLLRLSQRNDPHQVHDAHLAATLEVHGVTHLLTFNRDDFKRVSSLSPVHPEEVQP